jgi:hypothetical protein
MNEQTGGDSSWGTEEPVRDTSSGRTMDVQQMVTQLQAMIDQVAHSTGPALKQVGAKAAELAAAAAKRTGPIAISIASKTEQVSQAVADRAERLATDLRATENGSAPSDDGGVEREAPSTDPAVEQPSTASPA